MGNVIGPSVIAATAGLAAGWLLRVRRRRHRRRLALAAAVWEREGGEDLSAPVPAPEIHLSAMQPPIGARLRPDGAVGAGRGEEELIEEVIAGLEQVPPLPQAVYAILREMDSAGSSARSVGEIVASDPVIGAVLLRVVNSAAAGLRQRVLTVSQAVAYLGFSNVRAIVMRLKLANLFPARAGAAAVELCYDTEALWVHSMAVAQTADYLAKRTKRADPDLASTLGLLHDIGKLAINSRFPHKVGELWEPSGTSTDAPADESWLARERRVFGADHAVMGAFLATRWRLPTELVEAIRAHHTPGEEAVADEAVRQAVRVVHVANQLVKYRHVYCADMEIDVLPADLLAGLGLPTEIEQIFDDRLVRVIETATAMAKGAAEGQQGAGAARRSA